MSLEIKKFLGYSRKKTLRFSSFVEEFMEDPHDFLHTSSTLLSKALQHFGYKIVVRSGEPIISYKIFEDIFSNGTNAVFGQESAIKHLVDAIDSAGKETGPNRGLILVGPPASGKTNIIDLIAQALEQYTKLNEVKLYSFFFEFNNSEKNRTLEVWSSFRHNPLLLFPTVLSTEAEPIRPRQQLFDMVRKEHKHMVIPTYYQSASLDKCSMDILEGLVQNPKNRHKTLYDILEEYVRVEQVVFSAAQAKNISNIDDMRLLKVRSKPIDLSPEDKAILDEHLPGAHLKQYEGAMVAANRGILHIHDGFSGSEMHSEPDYKPLLMLLGSGKVSIDSTQASVDNTVVMTTNLEEMAQLEHRLTSSKLLDRIEKITVNYLLDANSEMDILKRDMAIMKEDYQVDPNLLKIASYYAVLTRLLPPNRNKFPENWSSRKQQIYNQITIEKKLFIYSYQAEDPLNTIQKLPHWHPFRNEALKLNLDLTDSEAILDRFERHPQSISLHESNLFTNEEHTLIDDEFMRELWREHFPHEGRSGISVRQLQNIMRNTISHSDGHKIHVGTFLSQLKRMIKEGPEIHHWLTIDPKFNKDRKPVPGRKIGTVTLEAGEADYGDFRGLVKVVQGLYYKIIEREITQSTVDREPEKIEEDLRRYFQYVLLANALENKAFAHIMVPRFTFIHPNTGEKVDQPDLNYMSSIEDVIAPDRNPAHFRKEMAQKFLEMQSSGEVVIEEGKTVINSRNDNVLLCFHNLYTELMSHRRSVDGINAEILRDAFFQKKNNPDIYLTYSVETRNLVETIIANMVNRFHYPKSIALDTIVFALRKKIVDFSRMIT